MYCMCSLCLQLSLAPPTAAHCGGQCLCQPAARCRGAAAQCRDRGRSARLQCCCVQGAHSTARFAVKGHIPCLLHAKRPPNCLLQGLEAVVEREELLLPLPQLWQAAEETLGPGGQSRPHPHKQSIEAPEPVVSSCAGGSIDYCPQVHGSQTR